MKILKSSGDKDINQRNHLIKIIESMVIWYNGKDS